MEDHFGNRKSGDQPGETNVPVFNNLFREKLTVMMKLLTLGLCLQPQYTLHKAIRLLQFLTI
jgi:hypothetical protein